MAEHSYFLGANTPGGFVSRYDNLFEDERIKKVVILKGGPGCGKSTLMRKVGTQAKELGCEAEEILCSSDPDSLDGIVIPAAGLAIVDGTAPHVLEPPLCGCGAVYLDLGAYYDSAKLTVQKEKLFAVKAKNAACYPAASACFSAAAAADRALHFLAHPEGLDAVTTALCGKVRRRYVPGCTVRRFYAALTPKGALSLELPYKHVWLLKGNFGLAPQVLSAVAAHWQKAGADVILGSLPLSPDDLSHVVIPAEDLAYVVTTEQFPYPSPVSGQYDLDALCTLPTGDALHAQQLLALREQAAKEGLRFLQEAKAQHDALEAMMRPAVDFDSVSEATEYVKALLLQMLAN